MSTSSSLVNPYLGIMFVAIAPLSIYLVLYYAEPGFPWHTYITLFIGYYASFAILLLVPIDIASVVVDRRSNTIGSDSNYTDNKNVLSTAYDAFFTIILILGSFVLVFEEYYNTDGYFSLGGKIASSFKRMCIDMAPGVAAGLIVLGILLGQNIVGNNADALKLAAIIVTNTVYEAFLMFLIAYALIEYPRTIWSQSDLDLYLQQTQNKAAAEFKDISDTKLEVSLVVASVLKTKTQLASYADAKLIAAMDILISECPSEFRSDRMGKVATNKSGQITIDSLAELRTQLNTKKDKYKMSEAKVEVTKLLAYRLEDIVASKNANNGQGSQVIRWTLSDTDSTRNEYLWYVKVKPMLMKVLAVIFAILSLFSFLGVVCSMAGVSSTVSVYYLAVHDSKSTTGGITIFVLITLGYITYITSWSLFQMRLAGLMELVPYRTTPESLSFNVRMIARLAAPLAFFYLGWINENGIKSGSWQYNLAPNLVTYQNVTTLVGNGTQVQTYLQQVTTSQSIFMPSSFSNFYQLQSVVAIQNSFGTIFPVLLFCLLFLFVTNFFNRILIMLKLDTYQFGAELVTEEQLREGKRQLQRHRKNTERGFKRNALKNIIATFSGQKDDSSFFGKLLGGSGGGGAAKNKKAATRAGGLGLEAAADPSMREPAPLSGMVEKKAGYTIGVGNAFKDVYAEVKPPGYFHIYKDKASAVKAFMSSSDPSSSVDNTAVVMDLRSIMDFKIITAKDSFILDIDLVNGTEQLRFKQEADADRWKRLLQEWKDFHTDYGSLYTVGSGVPGAAMSDNPVSAPKQPRPSNFAHENEMVAQKGAAGGGGFLGMGKKDRMQKDRDELDSVQVDDDEDADEEKGGKSNSSTGASFSFSSAFKSTSSTNDKKGAAAAAATKAAVKEKKPKMLEGWLEKKGTGKIHMGGDWQKRYLRIHEANGTLTYSKTTDVSEKPAGTIDFKLVGEIVPHAGKNGQQDFTRFDIDIGDKVFKFRATNEADGRKWVDGLNEWRDHFLMNIM